MSSPSRSLYIERLWRFSLKYQPLLDNNLRLEIDLFAVAQSKISQTSLEIIGLGVERLPQTELLLPEFSKLTWHLHPGETNLSDTKICQPVGVWQFPIARLAVACVEGTGLKTLDQWLSLASSNNCSNYANMLTQTINEIKNTEPYPIKGRGYGVLYSAAERRLSAYSEFMLFRRSRKTPEAKRFKLEQAQDSTRDKELHSARNKSVERSLDLQPESEIRKLGYHSGLSSSKRRELIEYVLLPRLGYESVYQHLAWLVRTFRSQEDGENRFANAISAWEHDLKLLEKRYRVEREEY